MLQQRTTDTNKQPKVPLSFGLSLSLPLLLCLMIFSYTKVVRANEVDKVLYAAEYLFKSMKQRDYKSIWEFLSEKSKETIVKEVHKALIKEGSKYSEEQIRQDFNVGGVIAKAYWDGFLSVFDPDIALEQSKWEIGKVEKNYATILLTYRKSDRPAVLKMFKEGGQWKVGLVETFWTRKQK